MYTVSNSRIGKGVCFDTEFQKVELAIRLSYPQRVVCWKPRTSLGGYSLGRGGAPD